MRQIFSSVAALVLVLGPITVAPQVAHAQTPVSVVGTKSAACPDAQFSTIQVTAIVQCLRTAIPMQDSSSESPI